MPTNGTCSGSQHVHWGSPNNQGTVCPGNTSNTTTPGYSYGQPYGYMVIELDCRG